MQRPGGEEGVARPGAQRGAAGDLQVPEGPGKDAGTPDGVFVVILGQDWDSLGKGQPESWGDQRGLLGWPELLYRSLLPCISWARGVSQ